MHHFRINMLHLFIGGKEYEETSSSIEKRSYSKLLIFRFPIILKYDFQKSRAKRLRDYHEFCQ